MLQLLLFVYHGKLEEKVVRRVLVSVGGEEKFSLDTPRAILARQAAKFILDAEKTIVDSFCEKLATQIQTLVQAVKS